MTTQLTFTPEVIEALNYERFHHPVPLVQRRMEVLFLKSHGLPHAQIAELGNISETTLREYFQLYLVLQRDLDRIGAVQGRPGDGLGWRLGKARWR